MAKGLRVQLEKQDRYVQDYRYVQDFKTEKQSASYISRTGKEQPPPWVGPLKGAS